MVENVDKLLKEKYENITTSIYNKNDILNIVNRAREKKQKSLLIKVYFFIFLVVFLSIFVVEVIKPNIKNNNMYFQNIINIANTSIESNVSNYAKILPKEKKVVTFSRTTMINSAFDREYKKYDYAFVIEVTKELDYTYLYEIDDIPKTLFEVKVLENLKGELGNTIQIYSNGGMIESEKIENGLNDPNSYIKYIPFNYLKIGGKYLVGINKIGDKLYVKDLIRYTN